MSGQIIIKDKEPDKITTGSDALTLNLLKDCAAKLQETYPEHLWVVRSPDKSVVIIFNYLISTEYGYVLHTKRVQNDPELKCVVKAGGELLERAYMSREFTPEDFAKEIDLQGVDIRRKHDYNNSIKVLK